MTAQHEICFISVDVETSGPVPNLYSLLSIGACLVDDEQITFKRLLRPLSDRCDPNAMEVTGLSIDELMRSGTEPRKAMEDFNDWINLHSMEKRPVFVGLNAAFDWSFVNYYFHYYLSRNPFGFAALDIKSLYAGAAGADWMSAKSSVMARQLGATRRGTHDPLDDALAQAELFRLSWALARQHRI